MATWQPNSNASPFAQEQTIEVYSRDWQGGKGPSVPGIGVNSHDFVDLAYDGEGNISDVKYYVGGPDGLLVSHLILTWAGDLLQSVRKLNLNVPTNPANQ